MPNVRHQRAAREGTGEDFIEFLLTGAQVKGEFHCAECGYGVTIVRTLPVCPMCGNESWEQTAWSPFARAQRLQ
jgi:rubrerythrin